MKKKKRRINWFHVFILLTPFIVIGAVMYILINNIGESRQSEYLNTICTPTVENDLETEVVVDAEEVKMTTSVKRVMPQFEEEPALRYLGTFLCTAYDDCYECQEEWVGTTALGVAPQVNHTIAVDPSVIPLGTHIIINGIEYVAEDVGGMINDNHIDIFVGSHEETYSDLYNGYFEVYEVINE